MLSIYICEDNKAQLDQIKGYVHDYLVMRHEVNTHKLHTFTEPEQFLKAFHQDPQMGIYLLDYDFGDKMDGLNLAQEIRKLDPVGYIIFVTTHEKYMPLVLKTQINTLDFIVKDAKDFKQQIYSVLDSAFNLYRTFTSINKIPHKYIFVNFGKQVTPVSYNDIVYIEVSPKPHRLILKTTTMYMEFYAKLDNIYSTIESEMFIKCNRSAIVNVNYIKNINRKEKKICLTDGKEFVYSFSATADIFAKYESIKRK